MMGPRTRRRAPMTRIEEPLWLPEGFLRRIVHLCTSCWCVLNPRSGYWIALLSKWRWESCWNRNFYVFQVASVLAHLASLISSFDVDVVFIFDYYFVFLDRSPHISSVTHPSKFPWTWHSHVQHEKLGAHMIYAPPIHDYVVFGNLTLGWNGEFWLGLRTVRDQSSFLENFQTIGTQKLCSFNWVLGQRPHPYTPHLSL